MSQDNVLKLLKKKRRWMISKEIAQILKLSNPHASLKRLYKQREIVRKEIKDKRNHFVYQYKYKK